uniref:Uncharacterized protein n=1 Tax=Lygus hesperus TaxID=30085 RepID=A0A146KNV3_LYGHE
MNDDDSVLNEMHGTTSHEETVVSSSAHSEVVGDAEESRVMVTPQSQSKSCIRRRRDAASVAPTLQDQLAPKHTPITYYVDYSTVLSTRSTGAEESLLCDGELEGAQFTSPSSVDIPGGVNTNSDHSTQLTSLSNPSRSTEVDTGTAAAAGGQLYKQAWGKLRDHIFHYSQRFITALPVVYQSPPLLQSQVQPQVQPQIQPQIQRQPQV